MKSNKSYIINGDKLIAKVTTGGDKTITSGCAKVVVTWTSTVNVNELCHRRPDGHLFFFRWTRNPEARALMEWEINILCAIGELEPSVAKTLKRYVRSKQ